VEALGNDAVARAGGVRYLANRTNPLTPQQVQIGVTKVGQEGIQGVTTVVVKCKIDPPHYRQWDARWANEHYDNAYDKDGKEIKVRALGCALSSMAMAMTALGDTVNPGQLNAWMKGRMPKEGGYHGSSINWRAIMLHSDSKILFDYIRKSFRDETEVTDPSILDEPLTKCLLVIVQVYNTQTGNQHWVVVTVKHGETYSIVDPGRGESTLSAYGDKFWSYVIIRPTR
jgi:hypothetical protein